MMVHGFVHSMLTISRVPNLYIGGRCSEIIHTESNLKFGMVTWRTAKSVRFKPKPIAGKHQRLCACVT